MKRFLASAKAALADHTTYTGISLFGLVVLVAHASGINLTQFADSVTGVLAQVAAIVASVAAIAKIVVPGSPVVGTITGVQDRVVDVEAIARRAAELLKEAEATGGKI